MGATIRLFFSLYGPMFTVYIGSIRCGKPTILYAFGCEVKIFKPFADNARASCRLDAMGMTPAWLLAAISGRHSMWRI
jgi:hypothetical protein